MSIHTADPFTPPDLVTDTEPVEASTPAPDVSRETPDLDAWTALAPGDLPPTADAPHGRRADGTPYKQAYATRKKIADTKQRAANLTAGPPTVEPPPVRPARKITAKATADYDPGRVSEGLLGMVQLSAWGITAGAATLGPAGEAYVADGAALAVHGPAVVGELVNLGAEDERLGRILMSMTSVGPYGALLAALTPLVLQIACNHNLMPPVEALKVVPRDVLLGKEPAADAA